jgi:DNA-binding PucR family transcriptional regulator
MREVTNERDPFKSTNGSLQDLVDKIKDVLNCPVTIEDANHRLLAYSTHDDETDLARIGTIIKRRVPENVINRLWKDGIIPKLMQSEDFLSIPEIKDIGLGHRIAISIQNKNEILGYMWLVQESGDFSEHQIILLRKAVKAAKNELLKLYTNKKKKDEDYQNFFWQLLTGQYSTHDQIMMNYQKRDLVPPTQFAVIVFQFNDEIPIHIKQNINYLLTINQMYSIPFNIITGKELIILFTSQKSTLTGASLAEFMETFKNQMKSKFKVGPIDGCSGTIYEQLDKIETSYQEALHVHQVKQQFSEEIKDVVYFQHLGIFQYLDSIIQNKKFNSYHHPAIEKLERYDLLNKTNLLETLEIFIRQDSNVNDAAKKLHVHTNTLIYRLKRISEIGDINLKNAHEKMSLYIELLMKRVDKNHRL